MVFVHAPVEDGNTNYNQRALALRKSLTTTKARLRLNTRTGSWKN